MAQRSRLSRPSSKSLIKKPGSPHLPNFNFEEDIDGLNMDRLRVENQEPFQHPAGFIRLNLDTSNNARLNVWPASEKEVLSNIHDHISTTRGRVICGSIIDSSIIYGWDQPEGEYEMLDVHRGTSRIEKTGLFYTAHSTGSKRLKAGTDFLVQCFIPHQTIHRELTATITHKTDTYPDKKAMILHPRGLSLEKVNPDHIRLTQNQIWQLIEEVYRLVKFSPKSEPAPKLH